MIKGVVFDLDGTLLNTIQDLGNCMNTVLEHFDLPTHTMEEYNYLVGNGIISLVKHALPEESYNASTFGTYLDMFREEYGRRWAECTRPYPGIPELLDELVKRGVKITVLSNKPDQYAGLTVKTLLPGWKFDAVFGERSTVPRKPDPAGALEIAHILNLSPEEFLYLGDTDVDMDTANAAGMTAIGALWGFRKKAELLEHGAKAVIEHPLDLLKLLE